MTRTRRNDRLASAALRAVSGRPQAELRGRRLEVDDRPILVVVPYLAIDEAFSQVQSEPGAEQDRAVARRRGVIDALGLRVRHCDPVLHQQLSPQPLLERVVFDIAEQFRCEALADPVLSGVPNNTAAAFEHWSDAARAARVDETGVGLLVFTITHMLRSRLLRIPTSESVDEIIEVTRGNLGRLVGHALKALPSAVASQSEFAVPAREIARLLAEMIEDATESSEDAPESVTANALLIPIDWDLLDEVAAGQAGGEAAGTLPQDYHVFSTAYDIEVEASHLYRDQSLRRLRTELETHIKDQAISVSRLAQQLQRLFPTWQLDGWDGGQEEGPLDPPRLAQLVADPSNRLVHRHERFRLASDTAVTFLIDTSGSMKAQRYESVAVLVDTLIRALEMAGASSEVLGFTTAAWGGGRLQAEWRAQGSPPDPGRLNEVQHVVYKRADQTWRQSRLGLAAMLRTDHYREGVDGEALVWAHRRLMARRVERRVLVMISDGAPMDAATANANRPGFLGDHLRSVATAIDKEGLVELGAVGIDLELDTFMANSISLDLNGTLTIGTYDLLHRLFAPTGRRSLVG